MSGAAGDNAKLRVAVLGGCGFIGRNLVDHLVSNDLVSYLRVVDKTPPQLAFLNPHHTKVFEDPRVDFKSADLINPTSCANALGPPEGGWELVVNCAGETRPGQTEAVYAEGIVTLSTNVAKQCAKLGVGRLVEISSGQMYSSDKNHSIFSWNKWTSKQNNGTNSQMPQKEDCAVDPWTVEGRMKSKVEKQLKSLAPELNYTILRPAIVYGIGDRRSLTPKLLLGAIYKYLNETMKLLWTPDLKMNTVHVKDLCRAIWAVGTSPQANGEIYNVVDEGDSTQGSLAQLVAEIFQIKHDYYGTAISTLAKTDIAGVAEEANDKHMTAWARLLSAHSVAHTPLEPAAAADTLLPRAVCLSGAKLKELMPNVEHPRVTKAALTQVLEDYASMNLFPKELL
ncbi:NAD dependent epimerase/dehydratase family domain-containing protein [Phthorimaea operculella]|nr:NAD dependent epimerase/dehydratase family domain-containing protein [Phthorimaea operculella]